jgi:hypothetical protein
MSSEENEMPSLNAHVEQRLRTDWGSANKFRVLFPVLVTR